MTRARIIVDVETYSPLDLSVVGGWRYARHPDTDVLCVAAQYEHPNLPATGLQAVQPNMQWVPFWHQAMPLGIPMQAYNGDGFDYYIWKFILTPRYGWPDPDSWAWEDLMKRAAYGNLPGGLDSVAQVLGTPEKDEAGHKLMMKLMAPARAIRASSDPRRLHTGENLGALMSYCVQDVTAEAALDDKLPKIPDVELPVIKCDIEMNRRGIRVDLGLVRDMKAVAQDYTEHLTTELRSTTRGAVEAATQLPALKAWLGQNGLPIREGAGALDRFAVESFLAGEGYDGRPLAVPLTDNVKRVLTIRRLLGKSSLAKLDALSAATDPEDIRVRGMFQYYGADRTGRWAGRIIQPQNLPKGVLQGAGAYDNALYGIRSGLETMMMMYGGHEDEMDLVMDVLASCLRACLIATPGNELIVVDYNAIECRVAAWFAGEEWLVQAFRNGEDPYKKMASWIYRIAMEAVDKKQRDMGKLAELSCQYGLGWRRFKWQAKQRRIIVSDEQSQHIVSTYRTSHSRIKQKWYELEDTAKCAIRTPGTIYPCGVVAFRHDGANLKLRLPSGRVITFHGAAIEMMPAPWDPDEMRAVITYWGEDSETKRWMKLTAWGGDFMAICCQGMARDLIANALVNTSLLGYSPVLTVHDELGYDEPKGSVSVHQLEEAVCILPAWANTLPVRAEGFASQFYRK